MKITMLSNAMSHHQKPFCDYMASMDGVEFCFVATKPLASERSEMGYSDLNASGNYIIRSYEDEEQYKAAMDAANSSDFVIYGSAPYGFIKDRLKSNKWTFQYSERVFKKKSNYLYSLKLFLVYLLRYGRYSRKKMKILCASAYAARDFRKFGFRSNQLYKWGYFPRESGKDADELLENKESHSLVWVGRMISLKHPETAVELAYQLKSNNIPFHLTMIGNGALDGEIRELVDQLDLNDVVTLTGALPTDQVRKVMEQSEILVTTSDKNEGWGAVINEGMSSACAVCASRDMGAAPFLIKDGENGYLFPSGDSNLLYKRVEHLLSNDDARNCIGRNAFLSIRNTWNAENAAKRLVELCKKIQSGEEMFAFPEGICSFAEIIK